MSAPIETRAKKRWWPIVVVAAVALVVGLLSGTYVGFKVLRSPFLWLGAVGQSYMIGEYSRLQYQEASYPQAKEALEKYLSYMQTVPPSGADWKPGQNPFLDARGLAQEKALTLARLALLEERNGHPEEAEKMWSRAESQLVLAKWKSPSRVKLRSIVERYDQSYNSSTTPTPGQSR